MISSGASTIPDMPAAKTATLNELNGEGEDRTSRPPVKFRGEERLRERPGSGRARRADRKDRTKEVTVDASIECI